MSTYIKFSGADGDSVKADEDIETVLRLWQESSSKPFEVKVKNGRAFINPERIACLREGKQRSGKATFS